MNTGQIHFDHEKLVAYQRSIQFVVWAHHVLEKVPSKLAAHGQLDRASTSVPFREGKALLREIVCLLVGLIRSISPERLGEDLMLYRASGEV